MSGSDVGDAELVAWLLQPDNPSVRYLTLREYLGRPAQDAETRAAREAIMQSGPAPAILGLQDAGGWWGRPDVTYKPLMYRSTVWQVMFLAELAAAPEHAQVQRACAFVLDHLQSPRGDFPPVGSTYHKMQPGDMLCYDGMTTWALLRLGYAQDARLAKAIDFIATTVCSAGFRCHFNGGMPCAWGAVKALRALAEIPPEQRTTEMQAAVQDGVEFLLQGDLARANYPTKPGAGVSKQWFRFGFPRGYQSDILQALEVLARLGYAGDRRLQPALAFLLSKRAADGSWRLEETPKQMWVPLEVRGRPSKWITLKALRVLQAAAGAA